MEEEEIVLLSDKELATSFVGDAYSMYLKEVFTYRLLSIEENKELARRYRQGDLGALEKLTQLYVEGKSELDLSKFEIIKTQIQMEMSEPPQEIKNISEGQNIA